MAQKAQLTILGQAEVEVEKIAAFLSDLDYAYGSILTFETTLGRLNRWQESFYEGRPTAWRSGLYIRDWPPSAKEMPLFVPMSERLVLWRAAFKSPGFWEFLGSLNPLEVIRRYLKDRHERRQDMEYRETAERRRLALENAVLENKIIAERIEIAKKLGATDSDLAPLIDGLVYRPLIALDSYQDDGLIGDAEISKFGKK